MHFTVFMQKYVYTMNIVESLCNYANKLKEYEYFIHSNYCIGGHYEFNIEEEDHVDDCDTLMKFISIASMIIFIILSTIIKLSINNCVLPLPEATSS